jgi:hypothetical protein
MPNLRILQVGAELCREMRPAAERAYPYHRDQVPHLIRQLRGPTQAGHDRAFDLLSQMGEGDCHLWRDIWTILDSEFGSKDITWH